MFDFGEINLNCFMRCLCEWGLMFDGGGDSGYFLWEFIGKDNCLGEKECRKWFKILYMIIEYY